MINRAPIPVCDLKINGKQLPTLPHQARFLALNCRNPLLVGGYGCGKSHIGLRKALWGAAVNPGLIGIYACLTYPLLRDAIIPELEEILWAYDLTEGTDWNLNQTSMTLTLPIFCNDRGQPSTVLFRPVEGKQNISRTRSITAAWAVLDEAAFMPPEAFHRVSERVRHHRARFPFVAAVTTPEGFNWVHERWVHEPRERAARAGRVDWIDGEQFLYVRGRTADNPNLDAGYVESLRQQYPPELVEAYLEGHFVPMFEGRCFRFSEREHVTTQAEYNPHLPIRMAWDFNVNPMSVSLNHWHRDQLWTFDEIVISGSFTEDVCNEFLRRHNGLYSEHVGGVIIHGDASGRARSTKFHMTDYDIIKQQLGHMHNFRESFPVNNPSQRESINTLNALFKNGYDHVSYSIHPTCVETIKSLLVTVYDDKGQIYKAPDSYEHLSDGLRYLAWDVAPIKHTLRHGAETREAARFVRAV